MVSVLLFGGMNLGVGNGFELPFILRRKLILGLKGFLSISTGAL